MLAIESNAQNLILSQNYASAQFLSPATVGTGVYNQRIQSNMRTQLFNNNSLFRTIIAGWDTRINNKAAVENQNYFGIGAQIMSDQLVGGLLQTNYMTLNFAYHLYLDEELNNEISIGLGGTFSQANLNRSKIVLGQDLLSQMGISGPSIENPSSATFAYDFQKFPHNYTANTGVMYTFQNTVTFMQIGASAFFYTMPTLINNVSSEASPMKIGLFINREQVFNEYNTYMVHASFSNKLNGGDINSKLNIAGAISFPLTYEWEQVKRLYAGVIYRSGEAIVPNILFMLNKYSVGLSYDVYTNSKSAASIKQNGFEISFSTSFGKRRNEFLKTIFD